MLLSDENVNLKGTVCDILEFKFKLSLALVNIYAERRIVHLFKKYFSNNTNISNEINANIDFYWENCAVNPEVQDLQERPMKTIEYTPATV